MDRPHFGYPFINWWTFGLCPPFDIMNNSAMKICAQVFVWTYVCTFLFLLKFKKNLFFTYS